MTELTPARRKTLSKIAEAGMTGMRPHGADLTTAYWLRQEKLVETFRRADKMQLQYRVSPAGSCALSSNHPREVSK